MLKKINCPADLKKLDIKSLNRLSNEIRRFLIRTVSETGGHLASNLGVVELTIALHYCFDCPKDKIIWDVGHQSYVHKILTGRKDKFNTLRQYKGLSGFPKSSESIFDTFDVGHSSTSVSLGFAYAKSRDLKNQNYNVVSVIGDGAITSGLAYEALNNAGRSKSNMVVILNDNQMSISENVGGITKHLNDIRSAPNYQAAKKDIKNLIKQVPLVGGFLSKSLEKAKNTIRYVLVPGTLFEELGFKYIGPIDGHNIEELIRVLNHTRSYSGPILLHVYTKKGKGYKFAEENPTKFHGISPFNIKTGKTLKPKLFDTYSDVFGNVISKNAAKNKKIVAISAAMPEGTGLSFFAEKYPDRFFDVGIAEPHAVTFAAGLAKNGFIPVVAIYSTFLQRAYDNILHDVCIQNLHVIFALDRAGIVGDDGETHQGIFDISFLSNIPNMTIVAPKNKFELNDMFAYALKYKGPIAIRYPRGKASEVFREHRKKISFAESEIIYEGEDFAIIPVGDMMDTCEKVVNRFKEININPCLINPRFIKPVDMDMIKKLADYKFVFVVENNVRHGGFYTTVLENLSGLNINTNVIGFNFGDSFVEHGSVDELFKAYGLDEESIFNCILNKIKGNHNG